MPEKRCSCCKKPLSHDCFWRNKAKPDGLQNNCKDCQGQAVKSEACQAAKRRWDRKNQTQRTEYNKQWRANNPAGCVAHNATAKPKQKQWCQDNPEKVRGTAVERQRRRRSRRTELETSLTNEQWQVTLAHFAGTCAYCGAVDVPLEKEHLVAVMNGGGYVFGNIIPACGACNKRKRTKDWRAWMLAAGYDPDRLQAQLDELSQLHWKC